MGTSTKDSVDTLAESKTSFQVEDVRITPAKLVFSNVLPGTCVSKKFHIANEGKSAAFIKISSPNIKDLLIDGDSKGSYIKPGFKLVRSIKIIYVDPDYLRYQIPIHINNQKLKYEVILKISSPKVSCTPASLNFGIIDEGVISEQLTLVLTNDGYSLTTFQIDMTRTKGHIILEPNRGIAQAKSKCELKVRVIPLYNGQLDYTLVIKCDKLITVQITATVIVPKLEAIHPMATKHFTLIYFPPTYFEIKFMQRLMIRNYSAVECMFVTGGEDKEQSIDIDRFPETNPDFKEFQLSPIDGIMQPQETKIFWITFAPKLKKNTVNKLFYFCTLRVHKIRCKCLQDEFGHTDLYTKTSENSYSFRSSVLSVATICSIASHRSMDYEASCLTDVEAVAYYKSQEFSEKDMIRIYLCGEAELPSVKIVPDELHLQDLRMQATETRVLELRNESAHLPIIVRYQKVPFVYLKKSVLTLKPLESKQIAVTIIPYRFGTISTNIVFDLMYHDQPKDGPAKVVGSVSVKVLLIVKSVTSYPKPQINRGLSPNYINEVGKNCQNLRFSSSFNNVKAVTVDIKKHLDARCNDLVALPNERRRSLRPWRANTACCTIFAHQPRYVQPIEREFEWSQSEQDLRKRVNTYYKKYIRHAQNKLNIHPHVLRDYSVTPQKKVLGLDLDCAVTEAETKKPHIDNYFIPLTPGQMKRIKAMPEFVRTGAIAAYHNLIFPLHVQNWNDFPVRLYIKSDKPNVGCIRKNRYVIGGNSCVLVQIVYVSGSVGYYAAGIDLVFNESMVLPVPLIADVVPRILSLNTTRLEFDENCTHRYVEITNNLNMPVKFYWVVDCSTFNFQPLDGTVDIRRSMLCVARYFPEVEGPTECTVKFISGECTAQLVTLKAQTFRRKLEMISKSINFENIPLQKFCVLFPIIKNPCNFPISFNVDRTNLKPSWIKVHPMKATLQANSQFSLTISVVSAKCVTFQGSIKCILLNTDQEYSLSIQGNVVYPDIRINPNVLHFQKIVPNTYSTRKFTLTNHCPIHTHVKLAMEDYEEFKITETIQFWDRKARGPFIFDPYEAKTFYIHFSPLEAMSTWFYLPIIIDKILGPPLSYDTITQQVDYYLGNDKDPEDNSQYISMPPKLPCVKITALSLEPKIIFSKIKVVLHIEKMDKRKSYDLKIKNVQSIKDIIYVNLTALVSPFSYIYDQTSSTTKYENGVRFNLEPHEETEITIIYEPTSFGKTKVFLPVYLHSEHTNKMHTALEIIGLYERPMISLKPRYVEFIGEISSCLTKKAIIHTSDEYFIYCRPLPKDITCCATREMIFKNHDCSCTISYNSCGDPTMTISEGSEKEWINESDYSMDVKISNIPSSSCIYTGVLECSCSCGGYWYRRVIGAYENSFLTTYAFVETYLKSVLSSAAYLSPKSSSAMVPKINGPPENPYSLSNFWGLFPLFPRNEDEFTAFMQECVRAVEMWVYTQGFFQEAYYIIPRCINDVCLTEIQDKWKKSKKVQANIPYVQLLNNLIGPQVNDYLGVGEFPTNLNEQIRYVHSIFKKGLDLVEEHGGTFSYISAEFFLPYDYFQVLRREIITEESPVRPLAEWLETIEEFHLLAKQSWLDLLLQTYKVFYLFRLPVERNNLTTVQPLAEFFDALPDTELRNANVHSKTEQIIIAWFQFHYDRHCIESWKKESMPPRVISVVGESFTDGLVFAAVTSIYCPYLNPLLQTIYLHPDTIQQNTHNLLTVIQAWEMLNYSFNVTPDEILKPNSIRTLMLMAYLYDILPSVFPSETIVFKIGLSLTITKSLKLNNPNDYPIAYKPIIIPENDVFTINQSKLIIAPRKTVELKIVYNAKHSKEYTCTLVLSGEVAKYRYAKNKCLTLTGIPDLTYPSTVITYPAYLYSVQDLELTIQTPYKEGTIYELRQSFQTVENHEELEGLDICTDRTRFRTGRLILKDNIFVSDGDGVMRIEGAIRTLLAHDSSNFLYFSNSQVGDFLVRVDTNWCQSKKSEDVYVTLSNEFSEHPERYADRHKLTINIPSQNNMLWDTIKEITCKMAADEDRTVWRNMLDLPAGKLIAARLYHLSRYLIPCVEDGHEIPLTYELSTDKRCNILLPSEVVIKSEYEEGIVEIEWKLKPQNLWPNDFIMTLYNEQFYKLRKYKIIFLYDRANANLNSEGE